MLNEHKSIGAYKLSLLLMWNVFVGIQCQDYLDSWACHKFWIQWLCKHNHMTVFASGFHFHRWRCMPTSYSSPPLRPYSLDHTEEILSSDADHMLNLLRPASMLPNNKCGTWKGKWGSSKLTFTLPLKAELMKACLQKKKKTYTVDMQMQSCWTLGAVFMWS